MKKDVTEFIRHCLHCIGGRSEGLRLRPLVQVVNDTEVGETHPQTGLPVELSEERCGRVHSTVFTLHRQQIRRVKVAPAGAGGKWRGGWRRYSL